MIDMKNTEEVAKKLEELKAKKLPHMTIESFRKVSGLFNHIIDNASEEEKAVIEKYLNRYYDDSEDKAPKCLFSECHPDLTWSLVHGVAQDRNTGLGWDIYHYLTINGEKRRYEATLQYHPDGYSLNDEDDEEEE